MRRGAVEDAVVEGQGQRQHGAQGNGPFVGDRFLQEPPDAQNGHLRQVQHRGGEDAADGAVIADGEGTAAQVGQRNAARVGQLGKMLHLRRKGQEGFAVHVLHHRNDQALGRVGSDAEVVVALDDQVLLVVGEGGIERRMLLQGSHHCLHDERQQGQVNVRRGVAARPPIEQFADVDFVNGGDRHRGCGRLDHRLGDGAPQGGQRLKLDRPMRILLCVRGLLGRSGL